MAPVVGRFAPTPSGYLHLGNLFCSLIAWLSAKSQGGEILFRSEDLDPDRSRSAYALQAQRDLEALGLFWDREESCQSQRFDFYKSQLRRLEDRGLVYPCFCSRAQLHAASAPHASDGEPLYAGTCRSLTPAQIAEKSRTRSPALRLRVPEETIAFEDLHYGPQSQYLPVDCGDFILRRSDGVYAYQLAGGGRRRGHGRDPGWCGAGTCSPPRPGRFCSTGCWAIRSRSLDTRPCWCPVTGRRLSKRDGDTSLAGILGRGYSPRDVVGALACLAGLLPEAGSRRAGGAASPVCLGKASKGGYSSAAGTVWQGLRIHIEREKGHPRV